jgi:hypothetical protein
MSDMQLSLENIRSINDNSETIVLVFYKDPGAETWENDTMNFDRVPCVGELISMSREEDWYEVKGVVHMGFPLDYDAEIYVLRVTDRAALRRSFG